MKNSALRENILLQTADYKCKKQDEIMQRYIFKSKRMGEENTPLPYTLLTKKISSKYFKKNMNQQVKISILNCEYMKIDIADIIYKLKNYRLTNKDIKINDHYPFDVKFSILDFFNMTNKFVNIYQILSDGSLKKINPKKTYTYNGQKVGSSITIMGTNCISIEFYDDGKAKDYLIEILGCVIKYDIISYTDFIKKYHKNNIYDETNEIITFIDGILVEPSAISKTTSNIEVLTITDNTILHYGKTKVTNNKIDLSYEPGFISNNLILPYAYIDESNNIIYKQYPFSVKKYSEFVPNSFKLINYDNWSSYKVQLLPEENYEKDIYYIDSNEKLYIYNNSLNETKYISLLNGIYYVEQIKELWEYDGAWKRLNPNIDEIYINTSSLELIKFNDRNKPIILDSDKEDIKYISSDKLYLDRYNFLFWKYNNQWISSQQQANTYYTDDENSTIFYYNEDGIIVTNKCESAKYYYDIINDNDYLVYKYSEEDNNVIEYNFEKIIRSKICLNSNTLSLWKFKESQSQWVKCKLTIISSTDELENINDPNGYYYLQAKKELYVYNKFAGWETIKFYEIEQDTIYFNWLYDNLWKFSYDNDTWNEYSINENFIYLNIEDDSSITLFKFNNDNERWYKYIPPRISYNLVYHVKDNIYYKFTFDNGWEPINVLNVSLIEYGIYFDDINKQLFRYNGNWEIIKNDKYYINNNMDTIWKYNNDKWNTITPIEIKSVVPDTIYFDKNNYSVWKYNNSFYIHTLILGDRLTALRGEHYSLYDELMMYYSNDTDAVEYVMNQSLNNENDDMKLLLKYPYYYREILEKEVKKDLYIKTLRYIRRNQIIHKNNNPYVKFTFPIKSFSFMLFLNGKLLEPDIYEENKLDMNIYILASKILTISDIYVELPEDVDKHDSLSNYQQRELSKFRHEYLEKDGYEFYYHNPYDIELISPLTIVRSKSFFSESNRYPLNASPIYLNKNEYVRYTFDNNLMYYTESLGGRYIKYNDRYYMISNYEYLYDNINKKFVKTNNDGDYYKIITNQIKVPYNKHLEENLYNLIFVKEFNENNSKVLEDVFFDEEQANSKYPDNISENANKKYNNVIRAHCNEFLTINCGTSSTISSGISIDAKNISDSYENNKYQLYDDLIQKSFAIINSNDDFLYLINNIINIIIDSNYVYYITNNSYIYKNNNIIYCTNIKYNISTQELEVCDNIELEDFKYLKYNLYTEENELIQERTDTRIHIDSGIVDNDNEKLIFRALSNAGDIINNNYDNIAIEYNKIYFFKNSNCNTSSENVFYISKDCYTYDLVTDSLISWQGNISYPQNIIYDNIEYLHKNIYDENNNIAFNRKGYPRLFNDNKSITMYNADIGYSKYYSSDGTLDDRFNIPQQIKYNYDQIMLFADGYQIREFLINNKARLLNHIKTKENDIFICNMPKLILYQTIEDLTLYSNITIEISNNFNNEIRRDCNYHDKYRKNIDIVHCPLSLKYMMIFVNNIYMDEDHIEIISNRRFMLKNLDDYPEIKKKKLKELYPNNAGDEEEGFLITSLDIYMYPFALNKMYLDYYDNEITYKDNYRNKKYIEYPLRDDVYDKYMSELVSFPKRHIDTIIFDSDNIKEPQEYYLSDFRYKALGKFTHDELSRMRHDRIGDDRVMSNYTHDELSKYTHDELGYFIYENNNE